jgi:5-methylcytosine-specific restriction protein A
MARALKVCSRSGCPNLVHKGRCASCQAEATANRGTAHQRGYGSAHRRTFRAGVLHRDPLCVCTNTNHGHSQRCLRPSTEADHHPLSRDELILRKLDPNDPQYGRGLCHGCHAKDTAHLQPGGWNQRDITQRD